MIKLAICTKQAALCHPSTLYQLPSLYPTIPHHYQSYSRYRISARRTSARSTLTRRRRTGNEARTLNRSRLHNGRPRHSRRNRTALRRHSLKRRARLLGRRSQDRSSGGSTVNDCACLARENGGGSRGDDYVRGADLLGL